MSNGVDFLLRRCISCVASLPILLAITSGPVFAQASRTASESEIAQLLRFRANHQHWATGMVVGVIRPSGTSLVAYGPTDARSPPRLAGNTIFEIASLSKILTDLLFADAVVRGEATLNDPLSAYVPPGVSVPSFEGRAISLADLATHTSGLPLRPDNLDALPDTPNKYADYTLNQLYAGLPHYRLTRLPGARFQYSNVAVALLGQGLALRQHTTYASLLHSWITGPLGMADTRLGIDRAAVDRLAQGHDIDLKPIGPTDDGALDPAGGLKSTANDLLRLLAVFLDKGRGELQRAARLMLTVDRPGDDKDTRMTLGWRRSVTHGETCFWSKGSGDGSRTFMGFNPVRGVAVVALANASSAEGLDDIGRRVLDPAYPLDRTILPVHHQIQLAASAMGRFLGTYQYAPDDRLVVTRGLTGLIVGNSQGQLVIYPGAPTRFFAKVADLQFDFALAGSGPSPSLVLRQDGKSYIYKRVP